MLAIAVSSCAVISFALAAHAVRSQRALATELRILQDLVRELRSRLAVAEKNARAAAASTSAPPLIIEPGERLEPQGYGGDATGEHPVRGSRKLH
jgi:hypothetical protein